METSFNFAPIYNHKEMSDYIFEAYINSVKSFRDNLEMLLALKYGIVCLPELNSERHNKPIRLEFTLSTGEDYGCAKLNCYVLNDGTIAFEVVRKVKRSDIRPSWTIVFKSQNTKSNLKIEFISLKKFTKQIPRIVREMKKVIKAG